MVARPGDTAAAPGLERPVRPNVMSERLESTQYREKGQTARPGAAWLECVAEEAEGELLRPTGECSLSVERSSGPLPVGPGAEILRYGLRTLDSSVSALLNLIVTKPISIFVWWLSSRANRTRFHARAELARRVKRAGRAGHPVLFASNHLSMFDDPVVPMALFRTGPRALAELSGLVALLILWWVAPPTLVPTAAFVVSVIGYSLGIALLGARKTWWSLGDLVNFSGASTLRSKVESGRDGLLSVPLRALLAAANPVIFFFMRSATVKAILVDRRLGDEGRQSRARAVESAIELTARGEQIWVFFEGGRTRKPDEIRPARGGIGQVLKGLEARGVRPLVIAIHHRGLEHVIPMSSRRWLTSGHGIDIRWSELDLEWDEAHGIAAQDSQRLADDIRAAVVRLQSMWRSERSTDA
jgi:1-acyl-sn-glycerol-3-phosphate acyltransferase